MTSDRSRGRGIDGAGAACLVTRDRPSGLATFRHLASSVLVSARRASSLLVALAVVAPLEAQSPDTTTAMLFMSDAPLRLRIAGGIKTLIDDRDSLEAKEHPLTFTYRVGDGEAVTLGIEAKTRGHWRRQKKNCDFPPLRLDFPNKKVEGTLFAGQDKLKLVTPCRPGRGQYDEYVVREYAVYGIYNLLTPLSMRVRRATTTYVDTTGRMDSLTVPTFVIEDDARMALRNGGQYLEQYGARFGDLDPIQFGTTGVFLYMIGATDWSLGALHNIELLQDLALGRYYGVTYDFDWTGIVNAEYATPDPRLRIRSVRDRLYRGPCLSPEQWDAVLAPFRERRAAIYALYDTLPGLSERYVQDTHRYLDEFYQVIDDPGKLNRELVRRCRGEEVRE